MSSKRSKTKGKPQPRKQLGSMSKYFDPRRALDAAEQAFHLQGDAEKARKLLDQLDA